MFKDGIIFIKLRGCETAEMFFSNFAIRLVKAKIEGAEKGASNDNYSSISKRDKINDLELEELLQKYREMEVLLILDNTEDLLDKAENQFIHNLTQILDYCRHFKILISTRRVLNISMNNYEIEVELSPLNDDDSVKLFEKQARLTRPVDANTFKSIKPGEIPNLDHLYKLYGLSGKRLLELFQKFLGGHPQYICLAASLMKTHNTVADLLKTM